MVERRVFLILGGYIPIYRRPCSGARSSRKVKSELIILNHSENCEDWVRDWCRRSKNTGLVDAPGGNFGNRKVREVKQVGKHPPPGLF